MNGAPGMERRKAGDGISQCAGTDHRDGCDTGKKIKDRRELSFEKAVVLFFTRATSQSPCLHEILTIAAIIKIDPLR